MLVSRFNRSKLQTKARLRIPCYSPTRRHTGENPEVVVVQNVLRQICDSLHQPVVVTDADGLVLWVNEGFTHLCGHSGEYLRGKNPGSVLQGPQTSADTVDRMRQTLSRQEPFSGKILNYHADGHAYWVELSITPIKDETGVLQYFIAFEHEIPSPDMDMPSICMYCKAYKDPVAGKWVSYEELLVRVLRTHPSHGICPDCVKRVFEE